SGEAHHPGLRRNGFGMIEARVRGETQRAIDELVASGTETGLQVAVIKDGRVVADVVSGVADPRSGVAGSRRGLFWAGSTFGMLGMNGSAAYADVDSGVAVASCAIALPPTSRRSGRSTGSSRSCSRES